jgi:hypothetical protein
MTNLLAVKTHLQNVVSPLYTHLASASLGNLDCPILAKLVSAVLVENPVVGVCKVIGTADFI